MGASADPARHPLRFRDGRWWIERDGRCEPPFFYCAPEPEPSMVRRFRAAGVPGVAFSATADFHPYELAAPVWRGDDDYDYTELDRRAAAIVAAAPDAWLLPRVHLCSPPWWDARHSDDLVRFGDRQDHRPFLHGYSKRDCVSWSSARWREAAAENLARFIRHARAQSWGRNVVGILVASGNTEEWFQVGTMEGWLPDYSPVAVTAFRRWIARRAPDARALSARWGFSARPDRAAIPPPALRRRVAPSRFRDPRTDAWVLDYETFLGEEVASFIGDLCGVVAAESDGEWFAGAFFGYLLEMVYHGDGVLHGGHLGLRQVLDDPRIHFLASPGSYANRDLERGGAQSMVPLASLARHGKLAFHENDVRTHLLYDNAGYGWTESGARTASAQRREAAVALASGSGFWWFDMTGSFYDDAPTLSAVAGIMRAARRLPPRQPRTDVAFVIDEESMAVTDYWSDRYADILPRQALELAHAGVAFDLILWRDLPFDHHYRWLIFPNLFRVERGARDRLARARQRAGGVLFSGAAGMAPTSRGPGPGPAEITGLSLAVEPDSWPVEVTLTGPPASGADQPSGFGRRFWSPWRVVGAGDAGRTLGVHAGTDVPALIEGRVDDRLVWYAADAIVPAPVLRAMARAAGAHVWIESGDWIATDGVSFGITARGSGVKQIQPPAGCAVFDAESGDPLPRGAAGFLLPMTSGETRLLFVRAESD